MISFTVDSFETVKKILKGVDMIMFAESLGGTETLITYPTTQTHEDTPLISRKNLASQIVSFVCQSESRMQMISSQILIVQ